MARAAVDHARRVDDPAERAALARSIARARAVREARASVHAGGAAATGGAAAAPAPTDGQGDVDPDEIRSAVREVSPLVGECYSMAPLDVQRAGGNVVIEMTISGEPGVGTVFDDAGFIDGTPALLAATEFTECMRETLLSVEMPPLTRGGTVVIHYPFAFAYSDDEDADAPPPPLPAPAPAPREDAASGVDPQLKFAEDAARAGRYNDAIRYATRVVARDGDNVAAWTVLGIAGCNVHDGALAAQALGHLSGQRGGMVRQVCVKNGVELPAAP
ncbi:MAG: hypothetical protein H6709_10825 [Kofleriaceae bacterium]|nr:hypothetical protein [Kofleriaceae bacterium]